MNRPVFYDEIDESSMLLMCSLRHKFSVFFSYINIWFPKLVIPFHHFLTPFLFSPLFTSRKWAFFLIKHLNLIPFPFQRKTRRKNVEILITRWYHRLFSRCISRDSGNLCHRCASSSRTPIYNKNCFLKQVCVCVWGGGGGAVMSTWWLKGFHILSSANCQKEIGNTSAEKLLIDDFETLSRKRRTVVGTWPIQVFALPLERTPQLVLTKQKDISIVWKDETELLLCGWCWFPRPFLCVLAIIEFWRDQNI